MATHPVFSPGKSHAVVKISHFNAEGAGSIPGLGAKIPHALLPKTKTENKQYFNKFHKDS